MGFTMGLNMLLLLAMVATNLLSLYHLSSTLQSRPPAPPPVPDHLLRQLHTIRATINHLTRLNHPTPAATTAKPTKSPTPSDLLIYTHLSPIASACHLHPDLLHAYMTYSPFSLCPPDPNNIAETLILRGCHPLPRRRCFSLSPQKPQSSLSSHPFSPLPKMWTQKYPNLGFDMESEKDKFVAYKTDLDLPTSQLFRIARNSGFSIRLGLDVGGGTGTFAARMKVDMNATVVTTTMNWGAPYNEAVAARGLVPVHVPLQQRLPVFDGVLDLVRCGRAVNRWIPLAAMEFLFYDVDRVLRGGGYLWLDRFFSKGVDLDRVYGPLIGKLGYKKVKWAVANKSDSSRVKNGEVYLTALLQKPFSK
ncbi:hypothetical protein RHGRI_037785 [Rhododendron griersonianum]|uniref:S-adenosyl-L-methionine-dependent methyltransferase n=1 Tax=Rhododendron griersonianum TaxID=479676 RepID=A0AAV6HT06_9ERIC|nr:hypothetical protein RHGRI_037785 [Rhododendron griersonianum]